MARASGAADALLEADPVGDVVEAATNLLLAGFPIAVEFFRDLWVLAEVIGDIGAFGADFERVHDGMGNSTFVALLMVSRKSGYFCLAAS